MRNVLLALLALFALMSAPIVYAEDEADEAVVVEESSSMDEATEELPPLEDPSAGSEES